jgi:hypothetical protein
VSAFGLLHPDSLAGLAPDCRRVLREEFATIEARAQRLKNAQPKQVEVYDSDRGLTSWRMESRAEARARVEREIGSVAAAIAEYRRVAALWGVEVKP